MEPVWIAREPTVRIDENGHAVIRVELSSGCDDQWERVFADHGFGPGFAYPASLVAPGVLEMAVDPADAAQALDWVWSRIQQVNEALRGEDQREHGGQAALAAAVHTWWEAHSRGRRPHGASPRCPSCGTPVLTEPVTPTTGPGVASCPRCGAEVAFAGGGAGELGGRIALADRTRPTAHSAPAPGAGWARCWNCGAPVPLSGASPAERTGAPPSDIGDTVTCPACGVEVPALADPAQA